MVNSWKYSGRDFTILQCKMLRLLKQLITVGALALLSILQRCLDRTPITCQRLGWGAVPLSLTIFISGQRGCYASGSWLLIAIHLWCLWKDIIFAGLCFLLQPISKVWCHQQPLVLIDLLCWLCSLLTRSWSSETLCWWSLQVPATCPPWLVVFALAVAPFGADWAFGGAVGVGGAPRHLLTRSSKIPAGSSSRLIVSTLAVLPFRAHWIGWRAISIGRAGSNFLSLWLFAILVFILSLFIQVWRWLLITFW